MPFPFSFRFSVPGIVNPFQPSCETDPASVISRFSSDVDETGSSAAQFPNAHSVDFSHQHPPPSFLPSKPLTRKRGWAPSDVEPSCATTKHILTSGYLDTPSKYRETAYHQEVDDIDGMDADVPAPKRRKGLAGSIVSTALSAALIGTAVGFTVYRLWKDRGKHPEILPPPPPYEQGEWVPAAEQSPVPATQVTPPTPRHKKPRHVAGRRTMARHRKLPSRHNVTTPPSSPPQAASSAFDFSSFQDDADDQMDWVGDRLQQLIEDGKRALGTEVVVMSEAKEDEVDDGFGAWVEDEPLPPSRSSSIRRGRRPRDAAVPDFAPPSYSTPTTSPRKSQYDPGHARLFDSPLSVPHSPRHSLRNTSVDSLSGHRETEEDWGTPELRESMSRAREMLRHKRSLA